MRRRQRKSDRINPDTLQLIFQLGLERYEAQTRKSLSDETLSNHLTTRTPIRTEIPMSSRSSYIKKLIPKKNEYSRPKSQRCKLKTTEKLGGLNRTMGTYSSDNLKPGDIIRRGRSDVLK